MYENTETEGNASMNPTTSVRYITHRPESQYRTLLRNTPVPAGDTMRNFINDIEDYAPAIPDDVTSHYMRKSGVNSTDIRLIRLFSLATQKFISDIVADAMVEARLKGMDQTGTDSKEANYTLTSELLSNVLPEHGMEVNPPCFPIAPR